jgi:hypothetical protein
MRLLAIAVAALAVSAIGAPAAVAPFKATLSAGTHTPKVNTRWPYAVRVVDAKGKPLAARISVAVVDPLGTAHPTEYYASKKLVTNIPFKGVFRDAVRWPPESRGFPLTFRVTVKVASRSVVLRYLVSSR